MLSPTRTIWKQVLAALEIELDPMVVLTWFKNTQLFETSENKVIISCSDSYSQNIIQNRYLDALEKTFSEIHGKKINVEIIVKPTRLDSPVHGPLFDEAPSTPIQAAETSNQPTVTSKPLSSPSSTVAQEKAIPNLPPELKKTNTLDNFVVGVSNRVVHAAAVSTIETPGRMYNPLFIYGSTGVGKTHLLHAIGNGIHSQNPHYRIIYTTTERFVNDLIEHLRMKKQMSEFRDKYRRADVLLIDDIQFLKGKESSQEEFYHTFNELHQNERQIVMVSDREPDQIEGLADRLVSRFQGGLIVKIDAPDFETRIAIVQSKSLELDMDLSQPVVEYFAEHTGQNVREIQGHLLQLKSYSLSQNQPINLAMARSLLQPKEETPQRKITPELILELVTNTFETNIKDLCGKKRKKEIVVPRQMTMFLLRNELGMNFTEIGEILGGRDHTTIMHGCDKIKNLIENHESPLLATHLSSIRHELYG